MFSSGSNSVKAKVKEEDIYFQDITDTTIGVYAPNKVTLDHALPKIKAVLIEDEVVNIRVYTGCMLMF